MALEYRNGKPYYYRKIRKGKKVISEYVGSGEVARLTAELDKTKVFFRKIRKLTISNEKAIHDLADGEIKLLEKSISELFTQVAINNGYHQHKRQWRKKRLKKKVK